MRFSIFATGLLAAGFTNALGSPRAVALGNGYRADGNVFKNRGYFDFSTNPKSIPSGLTVSGYPVGKTHVFQPANTYIQGGYLNLKVPGNQTSKPIKAAEVVTAVTNIKYASVRVVAIFADPAGVCNGMFFYKSDTQESDIEWLSDVNSISNRGSKQRQVWFANQDADGDGQKTWKAVASPTNPTVMEHEYRIDWVPFGNTGVVKFYIDGVQLWNTTKDVPSVPGPWVFNNWANGDKNWSGGPPALDAIFKIKEIDMYYNTTS